MGIQPINGESKEDGRTGEAKFLKNWRKLSEKRGSLSIEEKSELDHYMQLEHIMRLAKIRARQYAVNEK